MIPYDKPVVLEHIFYDFNRAVLRPESKRELDKLVAMLLDHPAISIELTAHTDRKGDEAYNLELSSKRAQAAASYLMESGVEEKRVVAVGRGKAEPKRVSKSIAAQFPFLQEGDVLTDDFIKLLAPNQQTVADQINRRTEFRVVEPTFFTP